MLSDLSHNIGPTALLPVFISKKLEQDHEPKEAQPSIVNQQCIVYRFACDLCDAGYVCFFNVLACCPQKFGNGQTFS